MSRHWTKTMAILGMAISSLHAQNLTLKLNETGTHYLKATYLSQVWLRANQSNPGTLVADKPESQTLDLGLRRTRVQVYGQVDEHTFLYMQVGQNNVNAVSSGFGGNRKGQLFVHDALIERTLLPQPNALKVGGGLTILNGLSRFSQPSVGTIATMDVPVFAQATVDMTDEFARKLSLYARGQAGMLDYRIAATDPFWIATNGKPSVAISDASNFAGIGRSKQYQGLFLIQFLDKEAHTTPYMAGTYLGKKRILNLELGGIYQRNAMWHIEGSDTVYSPLALMSAALFLDAPLHEGKHVVTAYAGIFHMNYGANYLRYNGIMNPGTSMDPSKGVSSMTGNAYPMFGTGQTLYTQLAYAFAPDVQGRRFQGYASATVSDYQAIEYPVAIVHAGVNWLESAHRSKISLDFENRPTYELSNGNFLQGPRKWGLVLQYQYYLQ